MIYIILVLALICHPYLAYEEVKIFDFSSPDSIISPQWEEVSDTTRTAGLSKATLSIIEAETDRRASMFTLLVPQPDGACFAGMNYVEYNESSNVVDISSFSTIVLQEALVTGLVDDNIIYKMILKDNNKNSSISFENSFTAPRTRTRVELKIIDFACFYRGQQCDGSLNVEFITALGLQVACGVYVAPSPKKLQSVSSIEFTAISIF
jgi:hypothetical protein